jgi:hypothetical protein
MKTKIAEIENINELMDYTIAFGVPTDTDSIVKMQDIIGHSTIEQLDTIANSNNGSRFYFLLFHVWSWEQATEFYNQHSNKQYITMIDELKDLWADVKILNDRLNTDRKALEETKRMFDKTDEEAFRQKERADKLEAEVLKLKAMLFNYMTKTA